MSSTNNSLVIPFDKIELLLSDFKCIEQKIIIGLERIIIIDELLYESYNKIFNYILNENISESLIESCKVFGYTSSLNVELIILNKYFSFIEQEKEKLISNVNNENDLICILDNTSIKNIKNTFAELNKKHTFRNKLGINYCIDIINMTLQNIFIQQRIKGRIYISSIRNEINKEYIELLYKKNINCENNIKTIRNELLKNGIVQKVYTFCVENSSNVTIFNTTLLQNCIDFVLKFINTNVNNYLD